MQDILIGMAVTLGFFSYVLPKIWNRVDWWYFGMLLIMGVYSFYSLDIQNPMHLIWIIAIFSLITLLWFKKELIPPINEKVIFFHTMLFWYVLYIYEYYFAFILIIIPTVMILVNVFVPFKIPNWTKIILAIWDFVIIVAMGFIQALKLGVFDAFSSSFSYLGLIEVYFAAMFLSYVMTYASALLLLIPTEEDGFLNARELFKIILEKFSDVQIKGIEIAFAVVIILILVLFTGNPFVKEITLINVALLSVPYFEKKIDF